MVAVVENGPNVIEFVFEADPAGDAAAAAWIVARTYPLFEAISEPDTEVGVPIDKATSLEAG